MASRIPSDVRVRRRLADLAGRLAADGGAVKYHRRAEDTHSKIDDDDVDAWYYDLGEIAKRWNRSRRQFQFLFVFIIVVGLSGGWFLQVHQASTDRKLYAQCLITKANAQALNSFLDEVISSVRASTAYSAPEREIRLRQYESIKQAIPTCERP